MRLATDPGRLTRRWFEGSLAAGLDAKRYVEAVSVITSSVVIDTLHRALGVDPPALRRRVIDTFAYSAKGARSDRA